MGSSRRIWSAILWREPPVKRPWKPLMGGMPSNWESCHRHLLHQPRQNNIHHARSRTGHDNTPQYKPIIRGGDFGVRRKHVGYWCLTTLEMRVGPYQHNNQLIYYIWDIKVLGAAYSFALNNQIMGVNMYVVEMVLRRWYTTTYHAMKQVDVICFSG